MKIITAYSSNVTIQYILNYNIVIAFIRAFIRRTVSSQKRSLYNIDCLEGVKVTKKIGILKVFLLFPHCELKTGNVFCI